MPSQLVTPVRLAVSPRPEPSLAAELAQASDPVSLLATAWRLTYLDPLRAASFGARAAELAEAQGDVRTAVYGRFLQAFCEIRYGSHEQGASWLDAVEPAFDRLDDQRGRWLCQDARAIVLRREGRYADSQRMTEALMALPAAARAPVDRFITLVSFCINCKLLGRLDDSLRAHYRTAMLADEIGDETLQAVALGNLGGMLFDVYQLDDARPVLTRAMALGDRIGSRLVTGTAAINLLLVHAECGEHGAAHRVLVDYVLNADKVMPERLPAWNAEVALALIGVGELARAEAVLAGGMVHNAADGSTGAIWTWVKGRLLLAQGRPADALTLCLQRIDAHTPTSMTSEEIDLPFDRMKLHEVVCEASETLGDHAIALHALRTAYRLRDQLMAAAAKAREIALELQHELSQAKAARDSALQRQAEAERDRRRLEELNRALEESRATLESRVAERTAQLLHAKQEAEAASRAKSAFLANMSHEIRTPLNGVIGMTEMLLGSALDARQQRYAEVVQHSAEQLLAVLNDILDYSKIEAGHIELESRPLSPCKLLGEVVEAALPQAVGKGLAVHCECDAVVPATLGGDPVRLRQILANLIGNAVKFTDSGFVRARVRPLPQAGAGWLRFEVQDTGIGINAEAQPRLFTKFMQQDSSTTRRFGGTGLGLAICKQLAEAMGGRIGFASEVGRGSTFWIELPFAVLPGQATPPGSPGEAIGACAVVTGGDSAR